MGLCWSLRDHLDVDKFVPFKRCDLPLFRSHACKYRIFEPGGLTQLVTRGQCRAFSVGLLLLGATRSLPHAAQATHSPKNLPPLTTDARTQGAQLKE